jgi:hypothetical protein
MAFRNMLIAGVAGLVLGTTQAAAGSCETWTAGTSDEEEGPTMLASACAMAHHDDALNVSCGGEGKVKLTYLPAVGDDYPPGGDMNYKAMFEFRAGDTVDLVTFRYQEMDGALVAWPRRDSDLVAMLKWLGPVTVTDTTGVLPRRVFSLKGSAAAIEKVERGCSD